MVAADGTVLRWSFDVVQDPPKHKEKLSVTAELAGTAAEVSTRTVGGRTETHTVNRPVRRTASGTFTVDTEPPKLEVTSCETSSGPPYVTVIEGTAEDISGVVSVRWQLGEASGSAQELSPGWAQWRAVVLLPDRQEPHEIGLAATDGTGHTRTKTVTVTPDVTPPSVLWNDPPDNPHRVLWHDGGVVVPVTGMATDAESKIAAVSWRLDGGPDTPAEQTSADWLTWRAQVALDAPGAHLVEIWAADMAGNESPFQQLQIDVQEEAEGDAA